MEAVPKRSKISRVDLRYRHLAQDISREHSIARKRETDHETEEQGLARQDVDEPLLKREQKGRPVMGSAHRKFHRRAAEEPSNVLTVIVNVVATLDTNGHVIAQETVTPSLPVVPSVPAFPTVPLPSVPQVPAFPSDLTVPAYPWPSGVSSVASGGTSSPPVISSPLSTPTPSTPSIISPVPSSSGFNATISSTTSPSIFPSSLTSNSTIISSSSSSRSSSSSSSSLSSHSSSRSSSSSSSSHSSASSTRSSSIQSSTYHSQSDAGASTSVLAGGGGGPANTAPPPAASTTAAVGGAGSGGSKSPINTPTVVGSVIGSLAGAALFLAIILILLKRYKRTQQRGALELSGTDTADNQPIAVSGQEMAARSSFVPGGAAAFFNRFSGASKSTAESSATGERGFQRISGRKLPSAFSEGLTSEQFARGEGTLSGSSFYRDDQGFYGGPGGAASKEIGKEAGEPSPSGAMGTRERVMPSPARTPIIHHPDDAPTWGTSRNGGGSTLSPPHSPNPDLPVRGTLGRSHPSHDGSRGSRFTEDV